MKELSLRIDIVLIFIRYYLYDIYYKVIVLLYKIFFFILDINLLSTI